jgi:hypothetical protein
MGYFLAAQATVQTSANVKQIVYSFRMEHLTPGCPCTREATPPTTLSRMQLGAPQEDASIPVELEGV